MMFLFTVLGLGCLLLAGASPNWGWWVGAAAVFGIAAAAFEYYDHRRFEKGRRTK